MRGVDAGAFLAGPSAFRAEQNRGRIGGLKRRRGERCSRGILIERDAVRGGKDKRIGEGDRLADFRQMRAPRLLARFEGDFSPALQAVERGTLQAALAASSFDGDDFAGAQFRRLLDHPFEAIEFKKRGEEDQARLRSRRGQLFDGAKDHVLFTRRFDFGEIDVPVVGDFILLAGFDAQHARQMAGVVTRNFGAAVAHLVHEKSAPHDVFLDLMIAHLRGTLLEKRPNAVILDVHGVGYDVAIPVSAFSSLPDRGQAVELHIYTHVREDALLLFGFLTPADKSLFEKLITVSGIGPKLAITTLGGLTAPELVNAIRIGAVEQLVRIPGVGKKTAERMVLELRDKLEPAVAPDRAAAAAPASAFNPSEEDVISALMNFGAGRAAAEAAVTKARSPNLPNDFDALFRRALKLVR